MTYHVATMTGFRGVARGYTLDGYANLHALVGEELVKLIERLAITASPFSPRTGQFVRAFSDAGEIVNRDGLICRLSLLDESITDGVVQPALDSPFSSTQPVQHLFRPATSSPCAFGHLALQQSSNPTVFVSRLRQFLSA